MTNTPASLEPERAGPESAAPGPGALFLAFLGIAISGFGGVLPFARRMLVERRGWLSADEFNETLSLCQSLPGPNIVNLSIATGQRFAGARGSVAAVSGLVLAPMMIVIALGALYGRFGGVERLQGAVTGLGAAAAGLAAAPAAKMADPLLRRRPWSAGPFILLAFAGVGLMHWPLPWVLLGLAPISIAIGWRLRAKAAP